MQKLFRSTCLPIALLLSACAAEAPPPAITDAEQRDEVEQWYAGRIERLTAPEGWLSLIGLHWLQAGEQTIGSAVDNDVVLAAGPAQFGTLSLDGVQIGFTPAAGVDLTVSGAEDQGVDANPRYILHSDADEVASLVASGTVSFLVIDRAGRLGLRVRDSASAARRDFPGIERFAFDPSWRIVADWVPNPTPRPFEIQTVIGTVEVMPSPGYARFVRDGREYQIHPVIETGEADLFIIFADRTSGRETYGPGRFFYAAWPKDGKIVLDFNKAYNPPCAFSEFSTCPLPPPENRLDTLVRAGEKKFVPAGH